LIDAELAQQAMFRLWRFGRQGKALPRASMNFFQMLPDIIEVIPDTIHAGIQRGGYQRRLLAASVASSHDVHACVQYYIMGLLRFPIVR
jgi:hypothetical protein